MEKTLALIKPDAFAAGHQNAIMGKILASGLKVIAAKTLHLSASQARGFYYVHNDKTFFGDLVKFMTEGRIMALALEGEHAISRWRELMGPTDATKAPKDTIRGMFGTNIERNATHGSDAPDTAEFEIGFFFSGLELS